MLELILENKIQNTAFILYLIDFYLKFKYIIRFASISINSNIEDNVLIKECPMSKKSINIGNCFD